MLAELETISIYGFEMITQIVFLMYKLQVTLFDYNLEGWLMNGRGEQKPIVLICRELYFVGRSTACINVLLFPVINDVKFK